MSDPVSINMFTQSPPEIADDIYARFHQLSQLFFRNLKGFQMKLQGISSRSKVDTATGIIHMYEYPALICITLPAIQKLYETYSIECDQTTNLHNIFKSMEQVVLIQSIMQSTIMQKLYKYHRTFPCIYSQNEIQQKFLITSTICNILRCSNQHAITSKIYVVTRAVMTRFIERCSAVIILIYYTHQIHPKKSPTNEIF